MQLEMITIGGIEMRPTVVGDSLNQLLGTNINVVNDRKIIFKRDKHKSFRTLTFGFEAEKEYTAFEAFLLTNNGTSMTVSLSYSDGIDREVITDVITYTGTIIEDVAMVYRGTCLSSWSFKFEVID